MREQRIVSCRNCSTLLLVEPGTTATCQCGSAIKRMPVRKNRHSQPTASDRMLGRDYTSHYDNNY